MKRFIRYLYEYENDQKKRNVGFVKVEQDGKKEMISVHGKGLCKKSNENISCYLIKMDLQTGNVWLIPAGELRIDGTLCGGSFCYTEQLITQASQKSGSGAGAQNKECQIAGETDICGLGLGNPAGPFYIALWNEEMYADLDIAKAQMESGSEPEDIEEETESKSEDIEEQTGAKSEDAEVGAESEPEKIEEEPKSESEQEVAPCAENQGTEEKSMRRIMKIQRGEISILPRCEWKLANNNFLLHGYYNYRHLVLIDEGDKLKLGVPGIYHEREARAAATFGFPEFIAESDVKVTLEPQERNENQQFGYWCRQVRRPPR